LDVPIIRSCAPTPSVTHGTAFRSQLTSSTYRSQTAETMTRTLRLALSLLSLAGLLTLHAQVALPYATGFDNTAQQAGWDQFRTGTLSNYDWGIGPSGTAPSAPNILYHDYPVGGSSTDTVSDWFVSPLLDLANGASLSIGINVYSIIGSSTPADQMLVMLLTGSNDPEDATSISLLADLTDSVSSSPAFITVPGIDVPATAGGGYIAFKYRATNNWFTISLDNVNVTGSGIGMEEMAADLPALDVFPNPAGERLHVRGVRTSNAAVQVLDATGRIVLHSIIANGGIDVSRLEQGGYAIRLLEGHRIRRGSFVKY
jgi:hypothetical protein